MPIDDSAYSEEQRAAAEQQAAAETARRTCELIGAAALEVTRTRCEQVMRSEFTRESVPTIAAGVVCDVLTGVVMPLKTACKAAIDAKVEEIRSGFWTAYEVALRAGETVAAVAGFVTNPTHAFEVFTNYQKVGAVGLFTSVMTYVTQLSSFDATAQWWRESYAATAGLGLVVMAIMLLLTLHQAAHGELGPHEALRSGRYFLVGALMLSMGPPVAWAVGWVSDGLSSGFTAWMGTDTVEFLKQAQLFGGMSAGSIPGGLPTGLLLFGLLFVAALGVLGTFLVQGLSVYLLGAVCGVAWGMAGNPRWRAKALRLPTVWVGLVLAKPAMLLVLGILMKFTNASAVAPANTDEAMRALTTGLMVCLALLFVAFAPWTLLKWFPLLPDGSDSVRSSGPQMLGAAVGAAGSTATTMAMQRARSDSASRAATPKATAARPAATTATPTAGAAPVAAAGPQMVTPAGVGARAATGAGTGARATGVAAGGAKTAAGAAGGAATGGALLAVMLASAAANAAVQKARDSAAAAAPDIHGGGQ